MGENGENDDEGDNDDEENADEFSYAKLELLLLKAEKRRFQMEKEKMKM